MRLFMSRVLKLTGIYIKRKIFRKRKIDKELRKLQFFMLIMAILGLVMMNQGIASADRISSPEKDVLYDAWIKKVINHKNRKDGKDKYIITYQEPTKIILSNNHINHLDFSPNIITGIIGNNDQYTMKLAGNNTQLFITPKEDIENNHLFLTIMLAGGRSLNLDCFLQGTKSPKIIKLFDKDNKLAAKKELNTEAIKMLRAMSYGLRGKYYVSKLQNEEYLARPEKDMAAKYSLTSCYRYGDLYGFIVNIKNTGKKPLSIKADQEGFTHLERRMNGRIIGNSINNSINNSLGNNFLKKGARTVAYVVMKKEQE